MDDDSDKWITKIAMSADDGLLVPVYSFAHVDNSYWLAYLSFEDNIIIIGGLKKTCVGVIETGNISPPFLDGPPPNYPR
jgi:hypothetical protein